MAADKIFPITMKPGILKDGTSFQGEYCTEGQWVRFYNGLPKKIGGMVALKGADNTPIKIVCFIATNHGAGTTDYFLLNDDGIYFNQVNNADQFSFLGDFERKQGLDPLQKDVLWQAVEFYSPEQVTSYVIFFGSNNLRDINNNSAPTLYRATYKNGTFDQDKGIESWQINFGDQHPIQAPNPNAFNGGIAVINNFVFVYGTGGELAWSRNNSPFDFREGQGSGFLKISNDKIIYIASFRGGTNAPTLLAWTLSSVIKLSNQRDNDADDPSPLFNIDVISTSSTIISTRCVVEYDGIFYWIGIDAFFIFNGVVRKIQNNINFNHFFNNVDLAKRQLIFAVKNTVKGEIWWYYPEKANAANPDIGCTRAIIYNNIDNFWYDTAITRDCGINNLLIGRIMTYGPPITPSGQGDTSQIWVHEEGYQQIDEKEIRQGIESSFTTPYFSFASFNLLDKNVGIDRWTVLKRLEPDFKLAPGSKMELVVNKKQYANSPNEPDAPINITGADEKIDLWTQGRILSLTFSTTDEFEMGHVLLLVNIGDGQ